jgi:predicted NUDIX family NTP pyrophosphohydrolase
MDRLRPTTVATLGRHDAGRPDEQMGRAGGQTRRVAGDVTGKRSAGIVLFRRTAGGEVEVLLGHMGGPFWARRDEAAWSLPKGEHGLDEAPVAAAKREYEEELGLPLPGGELIELGSEKQSGGKVVTAYALAGDLDPGDVRPGTFEMEWPRGSGRVERFPELDRVAWFTVEQARPRLVAGQRAFLDRLVEALAR